MGSREKTVEGEAPTHVPTRGAIQSYRDLRVWQKAMELAERCYRATQSFPREELYGGVTQIRRAATSVPANVAEGNGRENRGEYIQFLRIAQGSLKELETHVLLSQRVGLTRGETADPILADCELVGKMLRALIRSLQEKGR
jgi:four helix bundle protein